MADDRRPWAGQRHLTPDDVANRGFATSFRGFDTAEVRDYLGQVADSMRAMRDAQHDLERRLREAEERAAHPEIDESMLMAALGEETARLLRSAHEAAADIRAKAEENAERMLKDADGEIAARRVEIDGLLAARTAEADEAAAVIRGAAEHDAAALLAGAREEAEELLAHARRQAEAVVEQAASRRAELLRDLTRKRRVANIQVEQLRAGRERLLETYAVVRRTLDEVTTSLERAEDDARSAAFAAGNRAERELDAAGEDLADLLGDAGDLPAAALPSSAAGEGAAAPPAVASPPAATEGGVAEAADAPDPAPEATAAEATVADEASSDRTLAGAGSAKPPASATGAASPVSAPVPGSGAQKAGAPAGRPRILPSIAAPKATDPVDPDRPTSSLRIIRGPKPDTADRAKSRRDRLPESPSPDDAAIADAVSPTLSLVEPTSDIETVRVIPASSPTPDAPPLSERVRKAITVPAAEPEAVAMADVPMVGPADVPLADPTARPAARPPAAPAAPAASSAAAAPTEPGAPAAGPAAASPSAGSTGAGATPPTAVSAADRTSAASDAALAAASTSTVASAPESGAKVAAPGSESVAAPPTPAEASPASEAPAALSDAASATAAGDVEARPAVDDLFARIRAGREEAVAKAKEVLSIPPEPTATVASATSAPASADADRAADDAVLERRAALLDPIAVQLGRRLKRALQDDQNDALDRLRSVRGAPTLEAAFGEVVQQQARYESAARVFIEQAAKVGVEFDDGTTALADAAIGEIVADLAEAIVGPLRRRLEQRLHEAVAVGDDRSTVVERVGASYREWKSQRIERLAGDHVHRAFSAGAFANVDPGSARRWVVDDVDGACPDCDDNALAGPVPVGEEFPTGQVHPPAHAGCRCLLVPATV